MVLLPSEQRFHPGFANEPERRETLNDPAPWIEDRWPRDPARVRSIVLVLHGGQARSPAMVRRTQLSYLRMIPFARFLHRRGGGHGMSVRILRYRYRGWNEPELHPVDARWALTQLRDQHRDSSIVLLGHSMGGGRRCGWLTVRR